MKLIEVTVPPLDGTEFVVVWIDRGDMMCDRGFVDDGLFRMNKYTTDLWEEDIDAKFFVMGE